MADRGNYNFGGGGGIPNLYAGLQQSINGMTKPFDAINQRTKDQAAIDENNRRRAEDVAYRQKVFSEPGRIKKEQSDNLKTLMATKTDDPQRDAILEKFGADMASAYPEIKGKATPDGKLPAGMTPEQNLNIGNALMGDKKFQDTVHGSDATRYRTLQQKALANGDIISAKLMDGLAGQAETKEKARLAASLAGMNQKIEERNHSAELQQKMLLKATHRNYGNGTPGSGGTVNRKGGMTEAKLMKKWQDKLDENGVIAGWRGKIGKDEVSDKILNMPKTWTPDQKDLYMHSLLKDGKIDTSNEKEVLTKLMKTNGWKLAGNGNGNSGVSGNGTVGITGDNYVKRQLQSNIVEQNRLRDIGKIKSDYLPKTPQQESDRLMELIGLKKPSPSGSENTGNGQKSEEQLRQEKVAGSSPTFTHKQEKFDQEFIDPFAPGGKMELTGPSETNGDANITNDGYDMSALSKLEKKKYLEFKKLYNKNEKPGQFGFGINKTPDSVIRYISEMENKMKNVNPTILDSMKNGYNILFGNNKQSIDAKAIQGANAREQEGRSNVYDLLINEDPAAQNKRNPFDSKNYKNDGKSKRDKEREMKAVRRRSKYTQFDDKHGTIPDSVYNPFTIYNPFDVNNPDRINKSMLSGSGIHDKPSKQLNDMINNRNISDETIAEWMGKGMFKNLSKQDLLKMVKERRRSMLR